ncbi:MAG: hypothetical protein ACLUNO_12550 [Oscillospiraceae bacterium]
MTVIAVILPPTVLRCDPDGERYAVVLGSDGVFPGGRRPAGRYRCARRRARSGRAASLPDVIVHYTDAPLTPGAQVRGEIDWPQRFRRMQGHSGEHIISGLIHSEYGLDNVGFHLGKTRSRWTITASSRGPSSCTSSGLRTRPCIATC